MLKIIPIIISYFLGSVPSAYLIAKNRGIDITKKVKNGRIGTTSVIRKVGKFPGSIVALMDFCKGAMSIMIAEKLSGGETWVMIASGVAAIVGHNWSVFLRFSGGKGAAATFGDLFYLLPVQFFLAGGVTIILSFFLRKKKDFFSLPFKKKHIKKSNFLTFMLFILISFFALITDFPSAYILSPFFFCPPILLKKNQ